MEGALYEVTEKSGFRVYRQMRMKQQVAQAGSIQVKYGRGLVYT